MGYDPKGNWNYQLNKETNGKKINNLLGYAPQKLVFYPHLTIHENCQVFADYFNIKNSKVRINELLDLLELDKLKSRRADNLSGGQQRRLNLLLALLHKPKILFEIVSMYKAQLKQMK